VLIFVHWISINLKKELQMNRLITLLACLVVSSFSHAATGTATSSFDKDPDILLASNDKTWSYAAYKSNGLANVREFHDMGKSGVQQIDYVVNCSNQTMAMSGFQILVGHDSAPLGNKTPITQTLSFYKPVIDHDLKIASNACGNQLAFNNATESK
jgi:hypothetical protein